MSEDFLSRLDSALNEHDERKASASKAQAERLAQLNAAHVAFGDLRAKIIEPAMNEIGEHLKLRGHSFRISSEGGTVNSKGDPSISFTFVPKRHERDANSIKFQQPPFFTVRGSNSDLVYFSKRTFYSEAKGIASSDGSVKFADVTIELIKEKVVQFISEVLKKS